MDNLLDNALDVTVTFTVVYRPKFGGTFAVSHVGLNDIYDARERGLTTRESHLTTAHVKSRGETQTQKQTEASIN